MLFPKRKINTIQGVKLGIIHPKCGFLSLKYSNYSKIRHFFMETSLHVRI